MIVKYAAVCDRCDARSEEYHRWAVCAECGQDTCPDCAEVGTTIEDDEEGDRCLCRTCVKAAEQVEAAGKERR